MFGLHAEAADLTLKQLKEVLTFSQTWVPTEWGPARSISKDV